jgi:CRISPR/Cas system CMR subunit Cmr6 (Cas7 group RAMP superfamily)
MTIRKIKIEMLSDWRIGSGEGSHGDLDSTILRDREDFPYIPVSTLKGILRDAAEQAAHALDNGGAKGPWNAFAALLFGDEPALPGRDEAAKSLRPRPRRRLPPRLSARWQAMARKCAAVLARASGTSMSTSAYSTAPFRATSSKRRLPVSAVPVSGLI